MLSFLKFFVLAVVVATLATASYVARYVTTPIQPEKTPVEVEIPTGSRLRDAAERLERAGIPVGKVQFEVMARALGRDQTIKAGSYEFAKALTPLQLLDRLTRGDVLLASVRLTEGWTLRQVRAALNAHAHLRHETRDLSEAELLSRLGARESLAEGLFFPDTYMFSRGASDIAVLKRAYRVMQRHLSEAWQARDPRVPYRDAYQALIMASIIEKETGRPGDRSTIGGVLVNRLRIGMRLQADPTVIYGIGEAFDGNLKKYHLLADGPYNTYTRTGLPPTPIAIPGLASLRAALQPASTDALYYVSRGDGSSEFSRTLSEHNRAVRKFLLGGARK